MYYNNMNILVAIHLANDPEVENQTLQVSHRGPLLGPLFKKKHLTKSLIINYLIKVWLHPQCAIFLIFLNKLNDTSGLDHLSGPLLGPLGQI